jgi:type I restriction enzyme S subunit
MKSENQEKAVSPSAAARLVREDIVALGEIVKSAQPGLACGERDTSCNGLRQIRMNSFGNDGQLDLNGSVRIPAENVHQRYYLENGDLVFNNTNSYELVGRAALVRDLGDETISFSNHITRIRLNVKRCLPGFVSAWIQYQWTEGKLKRITTRFIGQSCIATESLLQLPLRLPNLETQNRITTLLEANDAAKTKAQRIISQTKQTKAALMQNLLLPNGKTRAKFKVHSLGELFAERKESGKPGLPTLSVTMHDGMVDREDLDRRVESELTPEDHLLAHKHDIAYNMMRMWQGVSGLAPFKGLVSPAYVVLRPLAGIDPLFASYLFKLPEIIRLFHRYSQGLTNDRLRLYYDQFAEIRVPVPVDLNEQRRIAKLLTTLDRHIEQSEALVASLRQTKAALCQQLFS